MMKRKLIYLGLVLIVVLLFLPYLLWQIKSDQSLDVLIMDNTVPDQSYREHKGIIWGLNHYKYVKGNDEAYDLTADYLGFHPQENEGYDVTTMQETEVSAYDLIYIADTYGVYEEEFYGENQTGERSELIYGGLTLDDMGAIEKAVFQDQTPLIAEFNSFASPTETQARERFTSLLGINWDGWIARYFATLDPEENTEIPIWMVENYQQQTGEDWDFTEAGLIFVRDDDFIVVLEEGEDFNGEEVSFSFTEDGESYFNESLTSRYAYWFDVIEATDAEVLANYTLGLTETGETRMREFNISNTIPAVTRMTYGETPLYYFAGDYADLDTTPSFHRYLGLDWLNKTRSRLQRGGSQAFYYRAYLPMLETILEETYTDRHTSNQSETENMTLYEDESITYHSRVGENSLEIYHDGNWEAITVRGVNMGMAKAGHWPGEASITFNEYSRWIEQIAAMGANAIRVYTIHPPEFYQALWLYNQEAETPLYLMHGVWIEEEGLEDTLDAYLPTHIEAFEQEMKDVVDVIHGNVSLEMKPGHASGDYQYDVSPYVLGFVLGIEWYPLMVDATNDIHAALPEYEGTYFTTEHANAFEKWLAARMDTLANYQIDQYQTMHPISFTNWPTTDLFDHPSEPFFEEDLATVNPNNIYAKDNLKTGYFSSYHVYPYYPDFLNFEPAYVNFIDHRGEPNNYAGYLNDLIAAHRMPVLIAEFGVPASRGLTHENPFGWDQGHHTEQEQGEIVVRLFEDIIEQGAMGGLMFTWQDEWFKRTWNTMDLDNPERRPYWSNVQTNEQRFGLLSFETHKKPVDGVIDEWKDTASVATKDNGLLREVSIDHDEAYLYLMMEYEPDQYTDETDIQVLLNTIDQQGNQSIPSLEDVTFDVGIDFMIELPAEGEGRMLVDNYYDSFYYQYGYEANFLEDNQAIENNDGQFNPIRLALNKPLTIPSTGESRSFDYYETGLLREGIGNPEEPNYDALADYFINQSDGIIEMRIPWMLLNMKAPGQKEIIGNFWTDGISASVTLDALELTVVASENQQMIDQLPAGTAEQAVWASYTWDNWDLPIVEERLKESYGIIQDYLTDN